MYFLLFPSHFGVLNGGVHTCENLGNRDHIEHILLLRDCSCNSVEGFASRVPESK